MNFTALRYFHEIALCGSIRQAAERVHVAASAVSRQISKLEHEFGAPLLERRSTGVVLTPAGELLARHTHRMFRDLQRLRSDIDDLRNLQRGEISLAAIEGIVDDVLPNMISDFLKSYPNMSFTVATGSSDQIVEQVVLDQADIGITYNARPRAEITVALSHPFPSFAVVMPEHALAGAQILTIPEILKHKITLPSRAFGLRRLVDAAALKHDAELRELVQTNSFALMKSLAMAGDAVAILPLELVQREVEAGALQAIPVADDHIAGARLQLCVHKNRNLSSAAEGFLAHMIAAFQAPERT